MSLHAFTLDELKSVTRNFSTTSFLGEGGFAPVYKGSIDGNLRPRLAARQVAVKFLDSDGVQGHREWLVRFFLADKAQADMDAFGREVLRVLAEGEEADLLDMVDVELVQSLLEVDVLDHHHDVPCKRLPRWWGNVEAVSTSTTGQAACESSHLNLKLQFT